MYNLVFRYLLVAAVIVFFCGIGRAQHINETLEFFSSQTTNQKINQSDKIIHSSLKPLNRDKLNEVYINDSLAYFKTRDHFFSEKFRKRWIYRKVRSEDFIKHQSTNFKLSINPLLDLEYKKGQDDNGNYYKNTRGIEAKGSIGNKFSFYTSFYENQARFEPYINDYANQTLVAPGQGAVKKDPNNDFDFSRAEAYINIQASKKINIQLGHSKHFIGEGYRSLLLSDNTVSYPFMKFTINYKKFQYSILWNQYELFDGAYYNYHQRKYQAINYLSWVPKAGFEISLFESVMWPGNTPQQPHNFSLNFFNPIILSRTPIYGLNSKKNILLGLNTRIRIYNYAQFFGQFALDDFDANESSQNNYAFQIGLKQFDLFHGRWKNHGLFLQAEYNYIAPYTYTWHDTQQGYTNYNQPIAHPSGTGLNELMALGAYHFKDLFLEVKASYIRNSQDTLSTNFGSNVFKPFSPSSIPPAGNQIGQGINNELIHLYAELAFLINPATNLRLFMQLHIRKSMNERMNTETRFYSFGLKTNINNYYYDF